jgi:hypothetical protein
VLPMAENLPNNHNSSSGLCGARRRARPIGAHRSLDSRSSSSSRVTLESLAPDRPARQQPGRKMPLGGQRPSCNRQPGAQARQQPPMPPASRTPAPRSNSQMSGNVDRWVRVPLADGK